MAIVYRIQDAEGRGPWKPGFSQFWVEDRDDHDLLRPWYEQFGRVDRKAIVGMHIGCGCQTVEQLRRWFTPTEYARLVRYGYKAVRMNVGRILGESDIQCVFERSIPLARDVHEFDLYETVAAMAKDSG